MQNITDRYNKLMGFLRGFSPKGMLLGLDRVQRIASALGNPQKSYPSIIVAGTNGKGSTCAMTASILKEAGFRVGLYTSPHLFDLRERIRINGEMAEKEEFCDAVDAVTKAGIIYDITFFELLTVVAFLIFQRRKIDVAVLEVGLGGRLDATNIAKSELSLITNIGLDHTDILGDSLEQIAFEKAGIIKLNSNILTCEKNPACLRVFEEKCKETGSRLSIYGKDFFINDTSYSRKGIQFNFRFEDYQIKKLFVPLEGKFQIENASIAIVSAIKFSSDRLKLPEETIRNGLLKAIWRGRMERCNTLGKEMLFDCAHNSHATKHLADYLSFEKTGREIALIYGVLEDKDYKDSLSMLAPQTTKIFLTRPGHPRSKDPAKLKEELFKDDRRTQVIEDPVNALQYACNNSSESSLICITGSIFLIAPLLKYTDSLKKENV